MDGTARAMYPEAGYGISDRASRQAKTKDRVEHMRTYDEELMRLVINYVHVYSFIRTIARTKYRGIALIDKKAH